MVNLGPKLENILKNYVIFLANCGDDVFEGGGFGPSHQPLRKQNVTFNPIFFLLFYLTTILLQNKTKLIEFKLQYFSTSIFLVDGSGDFATGDGGGDCVLSFNFSLFLRQKLKDPIMTAK